jgi:F-type H+-transporting ATPase subunit a
MLSFAPMLQRFAESDIHVSLRASELFKMGPLAVTSSMIYGLICSIFIAALMVYAARQVTFRPKKGLFVGAIESMVEYIITMLEGAFGKRETAARFAPIFGVYFIFIVFSNLLELVPWVGEGIYRNAGHGVHEALFRPFTADLNGTIAMAVIAILMVQVLSIREQGAKKHLQHYFSDKPLNPINFFIGLLEVFGEFTRILSLSLRLFLNTAVGEILITVFTSMIVAGGRTPFAVLPIILFEALVAYIQAYVFTVLAGTYLGMAIAHANHDDHPSTNIPDHVDTRGMMGG